MNYFGFCDFLFVGYKFIFYIFSKLYILLAICLFTLYSFSADAQNLEFLDKNTNYQLSYLNCAGDNAQLCGLTDNSSSHLNTFALCEKTSALNESLKCSAVFYSDEYKPLLVDQNKFSFDNQSLAMAEINSLKNSIKQNRSFSSPVAVASLSVVSGLLFAGFLLARYEMGSSSSFLLFSSAATALAAIGNAIAFFGFKQRVSGNFLGKDASSMPSEYGLYIDKYGKKYQKMHNFIYYEPDKYELKFLEKFDKIFSSEQTGIESADFSDNFEFTKVIANLANALHFFQVADAQTLRYMCKLKFEQKDCLELEYLAVNVSEKSFASVTEGDSSEDKSEITDQVDVDDLEDQIDTQAVIDKNKPFFGFDYQSFFTSTNFSQSCAGAESISQYDVDKDMFIIESYANCLLTAEAKNNCIRYYNCDLSFKDKESCLLASEKLTSVKEFVSLAVDDLKLDYCQGL